MASVRIKLSAEQINGLAATALPFGVIWAEDDIDAVIEKADQPETHEYLELLKRYRATLSESNPIYNSNEKIDIILELESNVQGYLGRMRNNALSSSLGAAAHNLIGVLRRDAKLFIQAQNVFDVAVNLPNLNPLEKASLLHNRAFTLAVRNQYKEALVCQQEAIIELEKVEIDDTPILQHLAATIYSMMAMLFGKSGRVHKAAADFEFAEQAFEKTKPKFAKASRAWNSNMIANHNAIVLSKTGNKQDCADARKVLASFLPDAKANNRFVSLFYYADATIKLAGFSRHSPAFNDLVAEAETGLAAARTAITSSSYTEQNYIRKAKARLLYLESELAYVKEEYEKIPGLKDQAEELRKDVVENREGKLTKFLEKFPPACGPFNAYRLFRQPVKRMLRMTPLSAVDQDSTAKLTR
jgi:hypothetical protein